MSGKVHVRGGVRRSLIREEPNERIHCHLEHPLRPSEHLIYAQRTRLKAVALSPPIDGPHSVLLPEQLPHNLFRQTPLRHAPFEVSTTTKAGPSAAIAPLGWVRGCPACYAA